MATIKTVALVGAGGNIGAPILKALLDENFDVTVLTRSSSSTTFPSNVKIAKIDYNDAEGVAAALKGQDALICAVGYAAILDQKKLVDAAVASGVKRIIPSEYGSDPESLGRQLPVFGHKVQVEQYIKEKIQGTSTTYSLICNNEFYDWDLDNNFGVDMKAKTIEVFDGGNVPYTATPLDFVAKGIAAVLKRPAETANRVVRLHGAKMTQNQLLDLLQRHTGKDGWQVTHSKTDEREKQGYQWLQEDPNNFGKWAFAFLQAAVWGQKFGGDFSNNNDNELLGLKEMTEAEVEEIVRSRA